ncbi:MAG: hypothetical protein L3J75_07070 [Methylococcaceae bacterium]|nr:hypothetical protein [Methylococcaceae bacterium]
MRKELGTRLLNIALRGLSMGSRFLLIFALAKLLSPTELGSFGLMMATVSISVLIVGADYYTYSQRELLARPAEQWSFVIQHQMKAQLVLYSVLLPVQLLIFIFGLIDWQYMLWFFTLLILDHIAQEINRLLVAMHKQLIASFVLFIRMGSWVLVIIPLMYFYEQYQNLTSLYFSWMIGSTLAITMGGLAIKQALPVWNKEPTDFKWLKKGFKVGGLFLLATICFKGLLTFDRYAVEAFSSAETLGVYVFYIGIIMGVFTFLDPAVFSFLYPRMLQSYQMQEKDKFQKTFRELVFSTLIISALLAVSLWFLMPFIIGWVDKLIYAEYLDSLIFLIPVGFIYAVGYIPHYALYAMKEDKWIISAHISAIIVFFSSLAVFQLKNSIQTVASALLFAFSWMAIVKIVGYSVTKQNSTLLKGS